MVMLQHMLQLVAFLLFKNMVLCGALTVLTMLHVLFVLHVLHVLPGRFGRGGEGIAQKP
jgi:hypothetical protein